MVRVERQCKQDPFFKGLFVVRGFEEKKVEYQLARVGEEEVRVRTRHENLRGVGEVEEDLKEIFIRFQENRLKIQPPKCKFCHLTFDILGFVATQDGLKPSEKKVKAMKEYPQPRTVKEAQSFLGIVSWLWRFIPRCATLTTNI